MASYTLFQKICWKAKISQVNTGLIKETKTHFKSQHILNKSPHEFSLFFETYAFVFSGGVAVGRQANCPTGNWPTKIGRQRQFRSTKLAKSIGRQNWPKMMFFKYFLISCLM